MVFSDLFFLFVFLPSVALCYLLAAWLDKHLFSTSLHKSFTARNAVLVLFSLIFYAWGEPVYVLLMLACVFLTYLSGRIIGIGGKYKKSGLVFGLICNIGILSVFKYTSMLVQTLNQLGLDVPDPKISLPIGISFYVFQSISYLVDIYRGDSPVQKNFLRLLLYISMFPQLIAGPIVRYGRVAEELSDRHVSARDMSEGMQRFLLGLGKKVILANQFSELSGQFMGGFTEASATTAGACLGTSTTTTYVESAAGVAVGGRTGLTAFVVALCFLLSLFFAPLFLAIPAAATGPALVIVGVMMCANTVGIDWDDLTEAIPAFVTMLMMPLSYSISDGIMLGTIMYVLMKVATGKKGLRQISPTMWVMFVIFVLRYVIRAIDNS